MPAQKGLIQKNVQKKLKAVFTFIQNYLKANSTVPTCAEISGFLKNKYGDDKTGNSYYYIQHLIKDGRLKARKGKRPSYKL